MTEENRTDTPTLDDWSEEYKKEQERPENQMPKFKIADGETREFTFLDEGKKIENEFGKSIVFNVREADVDKVWFVKTTKFSILNEITKNKPIQGKTARIMRVGSGMKDTRYSLKFL